MHFVFHLFGYLSERTCLKLTFSILLCWLKTAVHSANKGGKCLLWVFLQFLGSWNSMSSELSGCLNSSRPLERVTDCRGQEVWRGLKTLLERKKWAGLLIVFFVSMTSSLVKCCIRWLRFTLPSGYRAVSESCSGRAEWGCLWRQVNRKWWTCLLVKL